MSERYLYCPRCAQPLEDRLAFGKLRAVCPACGFVHFIDPKVAVVAFVEQNDANGQHVLLVQRANEPERGRWALPAGFVDRGEDPRLAMAREVSEETGLRVEAIQLLGVWRDDNGVIVIGYAAQITGGILCAGDDAAAARWFSVAELPDEAELGFTSTRRLLSLWRQARPLTELSL